MVCHSKNVCKCICSVVGLFCSVSEDVFGINHKKI